jgi:DNA-binding NarL/FixJ family response regulator
MSSVPKIAVAQAAGFPPDPHASPRALRAVPPPEPQPDELLPAALEADDRATPLASLSELWKDHVGGRLRPCFESVHPDRIVFVAGEGPGTLRALHAVDESIVLRVLCGEQQKVLALEVDVAVSTLSTRYNRALRALGVASHEVPVSLVLAAQCAAKVVPSVYTRRAAFEHQGAPYWVVGVPRPVTSHITTLSPAERQVAAWLIEGCSRREIAARRGTSLHTASRHIHSILVGLHASGRYALTRRAVELGCFRLAD